MNMRYFLLSVYKLLYQGKSVILGGGPGKSVRVDGCEGMLAKLARRALGMRVDGCEGMWVDGLWIASAFKKGVAYP
jgi:hypothetical protein